MVKRFDVFLINLDPTVGSEIRKTRPCLIVSPDSMNDNLRTSIIAPLTSKGKVYPTRVHCSFASQKGLVVLDQLRTVDKSRLVRKLGTLDKKTAHKVLEILTEMFSF